jgi:hypothetical protein
MSKHPGDRPAPAPRATIAFSHRPYSSAKSVGSFLPALTTKAFQKYGFSTVSLITDWAAIVGKDLAACTAPERLKWPRVAHDSDAEDARPPSKRSGAALVLRVEASRALNVQYDARQIIERINAYFGYAAVAELRLIQGPVAVAPPPAARANVAAQPLALEASGIADTRLRDALARLGGEIRAGR